MSFSSFPVHLYSAPGAGVYERFALFKYFIPVIVLYYVGAKRGFNYKVYGPYETQVNALLVINNHQP